MTQIARKLHRRGFIKCTHNGGDWWHITLTEAGKSALTMKRAGVLDGSRTPISVANFKGYRGSGGTLKRPAPGGREKGR